MNNSNCNEHKNTDNIKLTDKIIDLCLLHQIEEEKSFIKLIEHKIEFCRFEINNIENSIFLFGKKKKLNNYYKELIQLENKLLDCYRILGEKMDFIDKTEVQNKIDN